MRYEDELARKILQLEEKRDNIMYVLTREELSDADTLQLQAQLSAVQDEIVLLRVGKAA
jgi:hypothetical protein